MSLGPLIIGIDGTRLDAATRDRLAHPAVGGVILFSRNFESVAGLEALTDELRALRDPRLLVCVDQEGGRVQRFRDGFTPLPPLAKLGRWYESHPDRALDAAYRHGRVMAAEVLGRGVDLSLAPVLDLDRGSEVIGDRAFAADPAAVTALAGHYLAGMRDAGMRSCGKHFPGHGSVEADTHLTEVVDRRDRDAMAEDLAPFRALAPDLDAIMPAHVVYPEVDTRPAGFSRTWIEDILRGEIGYRGVVISDDLEMQAAHEAGSTRERLEDCLAAGCDLALVCEPSAADALLDELGDASPRECRAEISALYGRPAFSLAEQATVPEFRAWRASLKSMAESADV